VSQSPAFEWVCGRLESTIGWTRLVARGTVRLALKDLGLDPHTVGKKEMLATLRTSLPKALETHRIEGAKALCERLDRELAAVTLEGATVESPEDIFKRFGR
jgi:hypothetical protein